MVLALSGRGDIGGRDDWETVLIGVSIVGCVVLCFA